MIAAYLALNALLYLVFAVWTTLSPERTSTALGYVSLSNSGQSEYLVIYGGLQLGFAAFFAIGANSITMQRPVLIFAVCLYAPIVAYRLLTIVRHWPVKSLTLTVGALEIGLLIAGIALLLMRPDPVLQH